MGNVSVRREPTWRGSRSISWIGDGHSFEEWRSVNTKDFRSPQTGKALPDGGRLTHIHVENPGDYPISIKYLAVEDPTVQEMSEGHSEFIGARNSRDFDVYSSGGKVGILSVCVKIMTMPGLPLFDAPEIKAPRFVQTLFNGKFFTSGQNSE